MIWIIFKQRDFCIGPSHAVPGREHTIIGGGMANQPIRQEPQARVATKAIVET